MTGYEALHEAAAWLDLSDRGKIRATGEDRARLLHAMLTNDVQGLKAGEANYHFLLNAQGRIQADLHVCKLEDSILLDTEPQSTKRVYETLDHYIIADDVQLEDITERTATVAVEGPKAEETAGRAARQGWKLSATGQPGVWFFVPAEEKAALAAELEAAGAVRASAEEARVVRVENGIPRCGEDFGDTTLPQETQQMRALHFNKGCYLGQEIVERIRSRGQVHRLLVRVAWEGSGPPPEGVTSAVWSPRMGKWIGFAMLRRDEAAPGATVTIGGRPAVVI